MTTLWEMLGGEGKVQQIVSDFVDLALGDPRVNYTRGGRYLLSSEAIIRTKRQAFKFLGSALSGPYCYEGRGLREIHQGMQITDAEFDAIAEDFRTALQQHGIDALAVAAAMEGVESIRGQIVEISKGSAPPIGTQRFRSNNSGV